jgi:hypothetical protein
VCACGAASRWLVGAAQASGRTEVGRASTNPDVSSGRSSAGPGSGREAGLAGSLARHSQGEAGAVNRARPGVTARLTTGAVGTAAADSCDPQQGQAVAAWWAQHAAGAAAGLAVAQAVASPPTNNVPISATRATEAKRKWKGRRVMAWAHTSGSRTANDYYIDRIRSGNRNFRHSSLNTTTN